MNIQYQELNQAILITEKLFLKNPRRSISATFRKLRNSNRFSFFGDYPILALIVNSINNLGINPSRQQIRYTFNQSEELRVNPRDLKIELIKQLLKPSSVVTKERKNHSGLTINRNLNKVSFARLKK